MNIENELVLAIYALLSYAAIRFSARFFGRWRKSFCYAVSIICVSAIAAVFYIEQEWIGKAIYIICGLVAGTIEQWVVIWKQTRKNRWTKH